MAKKNKQDERKRKIGERIETIEVKLTPIQVEDERAHVIDLLQEKDELEEKLASAKAEFKARIAEVDAKKAAALGKIRSGRDRKELTIEEWLTGRNEVVRVDKETGEEIGNRRTATARELQEELPIDTTPPTKPEDGDADPAETETAEAELDQEVDEDSADFGKDE